MRILTIYIAPRILIHLVVDYAAAALSFIAAFTVLYNSGISEGLLASRELWPWAGLFALFVAGGIGAMGLYGKHQRYKFEGEIARLLVGVAIAVASLGLLDFFLAFIEWRGLWVLALLISVGVILCLRLLLRHVLHEDAFRRRVLVYGAGRCAARLLELRRRSDQRGFRILGFLPASGDSFVLDDGRVMNPDETDLLEYVRDNNVEEVIVAVDDRRRNVPITDLLECRLTGVKVIELLSFLERETGRVKVDMVNPSWLVFSDGFARMGRSEFLFRLLDVTISLLIALLAAPIALIVAAAIVIDDGFPVLYRQRRVGLNGKEFTLLKFRSMRNDAESAGNAIWAKTNDDRVTRVGRVIRKLRLDELPQLYNVLAGHMSFVGPRPERPEFVKCLAESIPYYQQRHAVKPGITGWAQLCYPYGASELDSKSKLEFDIYYIKNRSIIFNLMILLQTAEVILWQKGSR